MNKSGVSSPSDFEGVEAIMGSCDLVTESAERITDSGYCLGSSDRQYLANSASRVAVLQMLADRGVVYISARDRNRLAELAEEVRDFSQ